MCKIVLFTATSKAYANVAVDALLALLPTTNSSDMDRKMNIILPTHHLASSHYRKVKGVHDDLKDLSLQPLPSMKSITSTKLSNCSSRPQSTLRRLLGPSTKSAKICRLSICQPVSSPHPSSDRTRLEIKDPSAEVSSTLGSINKLLRPSMELFQPTMSTIVHPLLTLGFVDQVDPVPSTSYQSTK